MAKVSKAELPLMAEQIVQCLGGKDNIARINHCATRLRVNPVDSSKVDKDGLKKIKGVIGIDASTGEIQVIVGAIIEDLYLAVEKITGNGGGKVADVPFYKKKPQEMFSSFLLLMAGCLSPVIPALIASGLLSTVLTIMTLVLKVDAATSPTYAILYNLSQTVFYFLPVLVAYTSAKKFGTEPVLAMVLACFLLYPDWVSAAAEGGYTSYFGLPVLRTTYNGAVIQIILSIFVMAQLDKLLKKIIPEAARHFVKPFALLLIMSVVTLTVTGPLGGLLTNYIYVGRRPRHCPAEHHHRSGGPRLPSGTDPHCHRQPGLGGV